MFCKSRSDSDTFSESISGGRLFNIIADRIINSIITNGAQTAVGFLNSRFRTDSIAEPVNSDRKTDSVAFTRPADSVGNPWSGAYIIASGNLLADFRANLNAESQGRLQVARIYEMIDDRGVKDMLSVLLARDSYHQNLWECAVKELEEKEGSILVPSTFPRDKERKDIAYDFYNFSEGDQSSEGSWASGKALDGEGEYQWLKEPKIEGAAPKLEPVTPKMYGTPPFKK